MGPDSSGTADCEPESGVDVTEMIIIYDLFPFNLPLATIGLPAITTTTCCWLAADLSATRQNILTCQDSLPRRVANKSATSWQLPCLQGSYGERRFNGF